MALSFQEWIHNLSAGTIGLALVVLVAGAAAHALLRVFLHRRARRDEATAARSQSRAAQSRWLFSRTMRDCVPPIALLIWIHGIYLAVWLLLLSFPDSSVLAARYVARWAYGASVAIALLWLSVRLGVIMQSLLIVRARTGGSVWDTVMLPLVGRSARVLLPLIAFMVAVSTFGLPPSLDRAFHNATTLLLIAAVAWMLLQLVGAAASVVDLRHRIDVEDNLRSRSIQTQVLVLKKLAQAVIVIFTLASMMMVFDSARQFGAGILASAGIAGIVIGFAAQKSLANLLAGFQIALTQPIRLDDVVIVEKEFGRIEDITLTYVVVRLWDERRLVVPITFFIEQPFQNWTRTSAELIGSVFLSVDYSVPVEKLRNELTRVLKASSLWDGKVNVLQVTDSKERTIELRALMSAKDAARAWDLRCEVREKLIAYIRDEFPHALPRLRREDFRLTPETELPPGAPPH